MLGFTIADNAPTNAKIGESGTEMMQNSKNWLVIHFYE